jgi:hypothetical protein
MTDEDAKKVMFDGGIKLCEDSIFSWQSNKYTPHYPLSEADQKMKRENVELWRELKSAIKKNGKAWLQL